MTEWAVHERRLVVGVLGFTHLDVGATVVLKRRTQPVAGSGLVWLLQGEGVPHDFRSTVVGVTAGHFHLFRADQFTTVLLGQSQVVEHVHQEPTDGRAVFRTFHDCHVDGVDGDVADDVVEGHGDVIIRPIAWEVGGYNAVVSAVLQVGHLE